MLAQDFPANSSFFRRRWSNICAVSSHDFTAEWLLLIRDFYHKNFAIKAEVGAGHGQSSAPLTGSCFCCYALETLFLCVVGLSNGRIKLVTFAGIISFEFVINLRRGVQSLFQAVGTN